MVPGVPGVDGEIVFFYSARCILWIVGLPSPREVNRHFALREAVPRSDLGMELEPIQIKN